MRFKSVAVTAAAFTIAAALFASPATAAQSGITATEEGSPSPSDNSAVIAQLETLAKTQSATEVEKILEAGGPVVSLYDVETNEFTAAYVEEQGFSTMAITPRGPGCATTDACANSARGF
ncbi:hypothetical protein [Cryobacterium sp. GrIS_2_6]|uniref:hypothetical protein n=1 Tax=Cryobacterium sp. GrIS_2_6 TaxID=3162785 RepID=UPI002DFB3B8A|nr:hypothetical protein [Cryobacterium psychrotolerans]